MAKKAGSKTRSKKRRPRRRNTFKNNLNKTILSIVILIVIVGAGGWLLHYTLKNHKQPKTLTPVAKTPVQEKGVAAKPSYEVFPKKDTPVRQPLPQQKPEVLHKRPKVAIIIDDLGYDPNLARQFMDLNAPLTYAVLPFAPFQRRIVDSLHSKGFEIMLHLPMEPMEYPKVDPGEGALLTTMTPDELITQLNKNLEAVPYARGVNNHMGSRMTTSSTQLYQIFSVLKKRDLFFIDSRTTPETLCKPSARLFQLAFFQRDVFLDNVPKRSAIKGQLQQLIAIAESHGEAVGIAHPYTVTVDTLREMLPEIQKRVDLVPASEVVRVDG